MRTVKVNGAPVIVFASTEAAALASALHIRLIDWPDRWHNAHASYAAPLVITPCALLEEESDAVYGLYTLEPLIVTSVGRGGPLVRVHL